MDVQTIFTEIKEHGFTDYTDAQLLRVVNNTYRNVLTREPWPFLEKQDAVTMSANDPVVAGVASDFGKILSFAITTPGQERILLPEKIDEITKTYPKLPNDQTPIYYYFRAGALNVWPEPNQSLTGTIEYIAKPNVLTDTGGGSAETDLLLPPDHHEILVYGSLIRMYTREDDFEAAAWARDIFDTLYEEMRANLWLRQYDRTDYITISDPEDLYT